jgi:sugar phosphate isomerase/epimerase
MHAATVLGNLPVPSPGAGPCAPALRCDKNEREMKRRTFLAGAACAAAGSTSLVARNAKLQIGVTDWNLQQTAKLEAIGLAKRLGFEGVQVSLGRTPVNGRLLLDDPELQSKYVAESKAQGIPINGTCLDILHVNYLKNDPLGKKWVADSIPITRKLDSRIILLPFFGKGALTTKEEMDYVGDLLRDLGSEAEKQKVILGLENTISAEDNMRIMDRSRSKAVLVYYDIGNSTRNGFDITKEIRQLGSKRICQFHFKDNPGYIGEGKIDFNAVLHSISEIEYRGWANLETDSPSKSVEADMKRNLTYVRKTMEINRI